MDKVLQSQIAGAESYDRLMVPGLFAPWVPRLCRAAQLAEGHAVLDVACGTGVLAREAWRQVGVSGRVSALDVNPAMLAVADARAQGGLARRRLFRLLTAPSTRCLASSV